MEDQHQAKQVVRRAIRARLRELTTDSRRERSARLRRLVTGLPEWRRASRVLSFASTPTEPDLDPMPKDVPEVEFCYPKVEGDHLEVYRVSSPDELTVSSVAIREPDPARHERIVPSELDLLLIPGLAFTKGGERLGRGCGFFDRFLGGQEIRGVRVGICFDFQVLETIPQLAHDVVVDVVVTDAGVCR